MSPVFVIFCIIAFLIPVGLCFYYKHQLNVITKQIRPITFEPYVEKRQEELSEIRKGNLSTDSITWLELLKMANYDDRGVDKVWQPISVNFQDGDARLESIKITNTYRGLLEGDPAHASVDYWNDTLEEYKKAGHLLLPPVLIRSWAPSAERCLPQYKVEIEVARGTDYLWLCWFATNASQASLIDFINTQTCNINFSTHCLECMNN